MVKTFNMSFGLARCVGDALVGRVKEAIRVAIGYRDDEETLCMILVDLETFDCDATFEYEIGSELTVPTSLYEALEAVRLDAIKYFKDIHGVDIKPGEVVVEYVRGRLSCYTDAHPCTHLPGESLAVKVISCIDETMDCFWPPNCDIPKLY